MSSDGGDDPSRATTFDRLGQPKVLSGKNRWGKTRSAWAGKVLEEAEEETSRQGLLRSAQAPAGNVHRKLASLAQDRAAWSAWVNRWYASKGWWSYDLRETQ